MIPHENAAGDRSSLPYVATQPDVLAGLGLARDTAHATFTLALADGTSRDVTLEPSLANIAAAPPSTIPLYIERPGDAYWMTTKPGLVYIKYNLCAEGKPALAAFFDQVMAAVGADPTAKVVIDLRHNPGGNSMLLEPLIARLSGLRGRLYTVIGRKTFSSALLDALSLARIGATLVGEPTGGKRGTQSATTPACDGHRWTRPSSRRSTGCGTASVTSAHRSSSCPCQ